MADEVYRELARRVDALPEGYPAPESEAALRFLQKLFTPKQALLASVMTEEVCSVDEIARRARVEAGDAAGTLNDMGRLGLINVRYVEESGRPAVQYGLMPFVMGFYNTQLHRIDAEMAALFEALFYEAGGRKAPNPPEHRVIPVEEAVRHDVEVQPYDHALALIEGAKSWAVRDCICRTQQGLVGKGCDAPLEVCISFAPIEGFFGDSRVDRAITKAEALAKLREAAEAGLIHTLGNYRENHYYLCSCCTCCCGLIRRWSEFAVPSAVARSAYAADAEADACIACGACQERCPVQAITVDAAAMVDAGRCIGCGQCTLVCPTDAIALVRRPDDEVFEIPLDEHALREQLRAARNE